MAHQSVVQHDNLGWYSAGIALLCPVVAVDGGE